MEFDHKVCAKSLSTSVCIVNFTMTLPFPVEFANVLRIKCPRIEHKNILITKTGLWIQCQAHTNVRVQMLLVRTAPNLRKSNRREYSHEDSKMRKKSVVAWNSRYAVIKWRTYPGELIISLTWDAKRPFKAGNEARTTTMKAVIGK